MKYIPIRSTKCSANVHKMLLSYCKIQANLIKPDVPYIILQWCNNMLLNESPHISFMATAELMAIEGKMEQQYYCKYWWTSFLLDFFIQEKAALFIVCYQHTENFYNKSRKKELKIYLPLNKIYVVYTVSYRLSMGSLCNAMYFIQYRYTSCTIE